MKKRNIIGDYIQSAKLSCVTISNVFTNGVGCLVRNFYGRKAAERNMLISMKRKGMIEITKYKGAIVLNPKKNNKKRPVADLDFNSEYPNSIVTKNISKETKTQEKDSNIIIDDDGSVIARFKKHHGDKSKIGLMPLMSLSLLEDRKEAKRNMKEFKDDKVNLAYYTSQSNALKILANSIYGETGYIFSPLYDKEVASSVTAYPR